MKDHCKRWYPLKMTKNVININPTMKYQRKIFFHCGPCKTGSSALQAYFIANKQTLKACGISYENVPMTSHQDEMTAGNGLRIYNVLRNGNVSEEKLDQIIDEYFFETVEAICSSETLANLTKNEWMKIKASCDRLSIEVKLISFVRDIEPFYVSMYNQRVKRAGEWRPFGEFVVINPFVYNHLQHLRNIVDVFGEGNAYVFHYETEKKHLDEAIFKAIGQSCKLFDRALLDQIINRSLLACELRMLKIINRFTGSIFSSEISDMLIYTRPNLAEDRVILDSDSILILNERHEMDVNWVNDAFFNGEKTLKIIHEPMAGEIADAISEAQQLAIEDDIFLWCVKKLSAFNSGIGNQITRESNKFIQVIFNQYPDILQNCFDADFYLKSYPDIGDAGIDPYQHYLNYGMLEGRLPVENLNRALQTALGLREEGFYSKLAQARQQSETYLAELAGREGIYTQQLVEIQQAHQQQLLDRIQQSTEWEKKFFSQFTQAQEQLELHLLELDAREKAYTVQLQEMQQAHEQQKAGQSLDYAEREQTYLAQLTQARQQIESQQIEQAAREKACAVQLQEMQQAHEQQ